MEADGERDGSPTCVAIPSAVRTESGICSKCGSVVKSPSGVPRV